MRSARNVTDSFKSLSTHNRNARTLNPSQHHLQVALSLQPLLQPQPELAHHSVQIAWAAYCSGFRWQLPQSHYHHWLLVRKRGQLTGVTQPTILLQQAKQSQLVQLQQKRTRWKMSFQSEHRRSTVQRAPSSPTPGATSSPRGCRNHCDPPSPRRRCHCRCLE